MRGLIERGKLLACCAVNETGIYAGVLPEEEARTVSLGRERLTSPQTRQPQNLARIRVYSRSVQIHRTNVSGSSAFR